MNDFVPTCGSSGFAASGKSARVFNVSFHFQTSFSNFLFLSNKQKTSTLILSATNCQKLKVLLNAAQKR